jgi:hypothetical protein
MKHDGAHSARLAPMRFVPFLVAASLLKNAFTQAPACANAVGT